MAWIAILLAGRDSYADSVGSWVAAALTGGAAWMCGVTGFAVCTGPTMPRVGIIDRLARSGVQVCMG